MNDSKFPTNKIDMQIHWASVWKACALLAFVAPSSGQAKIDAGLPCPVHFANLVEKPLAKDSPNYVWSNRSSKKQMAKLSPTISSSDPISIVTLKQDKSRFAQRTPIRVDGFDTFSATYSSAASEGKANVSFRAELGQLDGQISGLPAHAEVLSVRTGKLEPFYVVEEEGRVRFYANPEAAHAKVGGKTFEEIGAEQVNGEYSRFGFSLSDDKERTKVKFSTTFFKNSQGNQWDFGLVVDESLIHPMAPTKLLSSSDFERVYPHDVRDLRKPQTAFRDFQNTEYLASGYDPKTGVVTVQRDEIKLVNLKANPGHPNELITSDQVILRRPSQSGLSARSNQIKTGDLFKGSDGFTYEVRSYNSQDQGKAFLRRIERREIPFSVFEFSLQQNARKLEQPAISSSNTIVDTEHGIFAKIKNALKSIGGPRVHAKIEGARNVSRVSVENAEVRAYGISAPGKELTYQLQGAEGPSILKIRVAKTDVTEKDLKRVDDLVSQIPSAHRDAISSITLYDERFHRARMAKNPNQLPAAGTCGPKGEIELFSFFERTRDEAVKTLWHEIGHAIAWKLWGNFEPGQEWVRAAVADGHFISGYSQSGSSATSLAEDIAETIAAYIATDGGRTQTGLRQAFKNRFDFLDRMAFAR